MTFEGVQMYSSNGADVLGVRDMYACDGDGPRLG